MYYNKNLGGLIILWRILGIVEVPYKFPVVLEWNHYNKNDISSLHIN